MNCAAECPEAQSETALAWAGIVVSVPPFVRMASSAPALDRIAVPAAAERAAAAPPVRREAALFFLVLWGALSWFLWSEWSLSEQYSYGAFVPFLAAALWWLRWEQCPPAAPPASGKGVLLGLVAVALAAVPLLRLVEVANPEWRPLGWLHALMALGVTLALTHAAGGWPWLRHLAFPACFFLVAVPWMRDFEDTVIQRLMRVVAEAAVEVVALFGIPAQAEGNLIRIGTGMVGVNEACSGVRSLQTSLMIGLLLGELNRFSVPRRLAMLGGAVGTALLANGARATYLVWVSATKGMDAAERQHDVIGYFILGVVFGGSLLLAWLLKRTAPATRGPPPRLAGAGTGKGIPAAFFVAGAAWLALGEVAVEGWYRWHERGLAAAPGWRVAWPEQAAGFRDLPIAERTARILRYDEGRSVAWSAGGYDGEGGAGREGHCMMFAFRWKPGRNSPNLASDHRPDVCLPASGLRQTADHGSLAVPAGGNGVTLSFQHLEFSRSLPGARPRPVHVFFALSEDVPRDALPLNPYAVKGFWNHLSTRVRVALAGRRNLGQQMIEVLLLDADSPSEARRAFPTVAATVLLPRAP